MNHDNRNHEAVIGWSLHAAGAATVVLVLWAFHGFVYQPQRQQQVHSAARIEQLKALLLNSASVQSQHRLLSQQLADLQQSIASMQGRLPEGFGKNEFESQVRHLAVIAGLEEIGFRPHRVETASTHTQAEVGFYCHGSFESMCRFLDEVDHLARITKVANLDVKSDPDTASNRMQGSFVLYYGVTSRDTGKNGEVL